MVPFRLPGRPGPPRGEAGGLGGTQSLKTEPAALKIDPLGTPKSIKSKI